RGDRLARTSAREGSADRPHGHDATHAAAAVWERDEGIPARWGVSKRDVAGLTDVGEEDAEVEVVGSDELGRLRCGFRGIEGYALGLRARHHEAHDIASGEDQLRRFERVLIAALDKPNEVYAPPFRGTCNGLQGQRAGLRLRCLDGGNVAGAGGSDEQEC